MSEATSASNPVVDSAIGKIGEIATLPEVTVKIIQIVEDPKSTARDLHDIIRNDPALSAKILKVVNSAFYGLPGQIASIDRAIVLLGLSAIKNIAIAMSMSRMFRGGKNSDAINGMDVWKHSLAVGIAARLLSKLQGKPSMEESFLAGLLHSLGLLVERQAFAQQLHDVVAKYKAGGKTFIECETEVLGADHQQFGAALAAKWRFPRPLRNAIGYYHNPQDLADDSRELPTLIHCAGVVACATQVGFMMANEKDVIEDEMLELLGVSREDVEKLPELTLEELKATEGIFNG